MNQSLRSKRFAAAALSVSGFLLLTSAAPAQDVETTTTRFPARAGEFSLKLEPGVAVPLSSPQSELFDVGGSATLKALWALDPYWDVGPSVTFTRAAGGRLVRRKRGRRGPSVAACGSSAPITWPTDSRRSHRGSTFDALYVRTDELNRPGFAAAVGFAVPHRQRAQLLAGPVRALLPDHSGHAGRLRQPRCQDPESGTQPRSGSSVKRELRVRDHGRAGATVRGERRSLSGSRQGRHSRHHRSLPSVAGPAG